MVLRLNEILVIFIIIICVHGQEDFDESPPDITPLSADYPMVFPEVMQQATNALTELLCPECMSEDEAWRAGIYAFLANNGSISNLTA